MVATRTTIVFVACLSLMAQEARLPSLVVSGAVNERLTLSALDLAKMPRASLQAKTDGIGVTYEGVWLHTILKRAGMPMGEELRGKALASYVLASGSDGYQVLFSTGEVDPDLTGNEILVADKVDGKPLFGRDGAFRLVLPRDKRGARSIRMLVKLEVVQVRN